MISGRIPAHVLIHLARLCLLVSSHGSIQRRQWHPTPVFLPGKSYGRRSLVGCSPWGPWGSDTTQRLHFHFSLSCLGEENGNTLQCSCLENPRDGGAWGAAVYGVAQSRTRLKWLSSSSSMEAFNPFTVKLIIDMYDPITYHFLNCFGFILSKSFPSLVFPA